MAKRFALLLVFITLVVLLAAMNWFSTIIDLEATPQYVLALPILAGIVGGIAAPYDLSWIVTRSSLILAGLGGAIIIILYFALDEVQNQTSTTIGEAIGSIIVIVILIALIVSIAVGSVAFMILIGIGALIGGLIARQFVTEPKRVSKKRKKK